MRNEQVWIIMPVYNESPGIYQPLIASLLQIGYRVVVVDDGSVQPVVKKGNEIIFRHEKNLGQGAALSTGMQYVIRQQADCVVHMDSDGQHQVSDLESIVQPILRHESDIVTGSRFQHGASIQSIPMLRRYTLRIARIVNTWFTGKRLTDAHNGFRAMKPRCLPHLLHLIPGREHASQIVFIAHRHKWKLKEVAVHIRYEPADEARRIPWTELIALFIRLCRFRLSGYRFHDAEMMNIQARALEKQIV